MRRLKPQAARRPGAWRLRLRRARKMLRPRSLMWGGAVLGALALVAVSVGIWRGGVIQGTADALFAGAAESLAFTGMRLQRVDVEGRVHTPPTVIAAAVDAQRGAPILKISPHEVQARLLANPWIERAEVRRVLPDRIEITLTERKPFALWQRQGRHAVIDRDGTVIAEDRVTEFGTLPLVVGAGAAPLAAAILELVDRHPAIKERFRAAVRVGERRWNIRLATGADVMLPEGAEAAALERLASLHAQQALLDRALAAVDMRLPDRMVLRPLAPPTGQGGAPEPSTPPPRPANARVRG
jgi:cell division protein FtsQ